jgi:hypothetical protein
MKRPLRQGRTFNLNPRKEDKTQPLFASLFALQNAGRSQNLLAVADGGHHLARLGEVPDQLQHLLVQAQVLGGPPPGHYQGVVALRRDAGKVGGEAEVVAGLLGVGLVALQEKKEGKYSVCLQYLG